MTANQIKYQQLLEDQRANVARETETNRANLAGEALRRSELEETSRHNVVSENETMRSNLAREFETNRHNVVAENETQRHNVATENETKRSNLANESIKRQNLSLGYAQLDETAHYHDDAVTAQLINTSELNRAYYAREQQNFREYQENQRQFEKDYKLRDKQVKLNALASLYSTTAQQNSNSLRTGVNLIGTIARLIN